MAYMESRSFLPNDHALCNDVQRFPCRVGENKPCTSSKPKSPPYKELVEKHAIYDQVKCNTERAFLAKSYGCKGRYAFMRLPNHDRTLKQCTPSPMLSPLWWGCYQVLPISARCCDVQTVKGMDINIFVGFLNYLSLVFIYIFLETLCSALK